MTDTDIENKILRMISSCENMYQLDTTRKYIKLRYDNQWPEIIRTSFDLKYGCVIYT